ncbi:MAG: glycosyltransferase family 2 protein [Acidimicrobiia bacterium]
MSPAPPEPITTITVVPRDSFAQTQRCLDALLAVTPAPRRLVYVDGGSPPEVAAYLRKRAHEHDFALIRSDCLLSPNQARNLTLPYLNTEYTAFLDNDALVSDGWLARLERCAHETGAAVVTPLLAMGELDDDVLHLATGVSHIGEAHGVRRFVEHHDGQNGPLGPVLASATRCETELFEFHAALVRTDALEAVAPLDEGLLSICEHGDLGLLIRELGGTVWFEPAVHMTYLPTKRLRGADRAFFIVRWSEDWNRRSAKRFVEKWRLSPDDPRVQETVEFGAWVRLHAYRPYRSPFTRVLRRYARTPRPIVDRVAQRIALRNFRNRAERSGPPFLAHRPTWLGVDVHA